MSIKTVAKTSLVISAMALTMVQFQSVLVNQARGQAPLTAPLTNFVTITPTPTVQIPLTAPVQNTNPTPPLTAPQQTPSSTFTVKGKHVDQNGNPANLTGLGVRIYGPNSNAFQDILGQTFISSSLSAGTYRLAVITPSQQPDGTEYDTFFSMCGNCTQHDSFLPYVGHIPMYFYEGTQNGLGNYDNFESFVIKYVARPKQPQQGGNSGGGNNNGGSNGGGNSGGGGGGSSSNNGGSNGGGGNVCRDERPKSAPIILSVRATGANQVTLSWKKGWAPFNGYVISYSTKRGVTQFTTDVFGANTTVATVKGLNGNTTYFFRIQAKNGCVSGDYSRELSVRTYGKTAPVTKILGTKVKKASPVKAIKPVVQKKNK